jgi:hypothetical protein
VHCRRSSRQDNEGPFSSQIPVRVVLPNPADRHGARTASSW